MGWNGSGTFDLIYSWENDAANGIKILAPRMDTQENDMATNGFGNCITRDGQGVPTANISWATYKITNLGNGSATTDAAAYGQVRAAVGALQGFIGGLQLSAAGSTGTFGVAAGTASDKTNVQLMNLASAFTKTTATWVAGSGNGGIDTGSIANSTWYHVYLISDPTLTTGDIIFSLSASVPAFPTGYTLARRIGSMKTDSSAHWKMFTQIGDDFIWAVPVNDVNANGWGSTTTLHVLASVPTGITVKPHVRAAGLETQGNPYQYLLQGAQEASATQGVPNGNLTAWCAANGIAQFDGYVAWTNTSAQIGISSNASANTIDIATVGWVDLRGSL